MSIKPEVPDARRRILDAAIVVIDLDGEAALRITDIADRAGVATGLINHHFGSRDGLVAAAQAERFAGLVGVNLGMFRAIFNEKLPHAETASVLRETFAGIVGRVHLSDRLSRASALGAAHGRPDLQLAISRTTSTFIGEATEIVRVGQQMGIVRSELDARAIATVLLSFTFGFVIADFDDEPASYEELAQVLESLIDLLLVPAP